MQECIEKHKNLKRKLVNYLHITEKSCTFAGEIQIHTIT